MCSRECRWVVVLVEEAGELLVMARRYAKLGVPPRMVEPAGGDDVLAACRLPGRLRVLGPLCMSSGSVVSLGPAF